MKQCNWSKDSRHHKSWQRMKKYFLQDMQIPLDKNVLILSYKTHKICNFDLYLRGSCNPANLTVKLSFDLYDCSNLYRSFKAIQTLVWSLFYWHLNGLCVRLLKDFFCFFNLEYNNKFWVLFLTIFAFNFLFKLT